MSISNAPEGLNIIYRRDNKTDGNGVPVTHKNMKNCMASVL